MAALAVEPVKAPNHAHYGGQEEVSQNVSGEEEALVAPALDFSS